MKRFVRTTGLSLAALAATLLLVLQAVLGASAGANTLLIMGGNDNGAGANMEKELNGYISGAPGTPYDGYTLTKVPWAATSGGVSLLSGGRTYDDSQADGVEKISAAIANTLAADPEGQVVVVGYSSSANVVTKVIRNLNAQRAADASGTPSPGNLSFLVFGNPNRPNGGVLGRFEGLHIPFPLDITFDGETPPSDYKVTDIAWQYDGYADFPKDTRNLLAVVNAVIGIVTLHGFYYDADPTNPDNIVSDETVGNTRYVTLKSSLPLLAGLYGLGIPPQLLTGLDSFLRGEIEKAYDRSPAVPVISTVTAASTVSDSDTSTSSKVAVSRKKVVTSHDATTASTTTTPETSTAATTTESVDPTTESTGPSTSSTTSKAGTTTTTESTTMAPTTSVSPTSTPGMDESDSPTPSGSGVSDSSVTRTVPAAA